MLVLLEGTKNTSYWGLYPQRLEITSHQFASPDQQRRCFSPPIFWTIPTYFHILIELTKSRGSSHKFTKMCDHKIEPLFSTWTNAKIRQERTSNQKLSWHASRVTSHLLVVDSICCFLFLILFRKWSKLIRFDFLIYIVGIQSPCQGMIGCPNHLLTVSIVSWFHYHSQEVIGSLGYVFNWVAQAPTSHPLSKQFALVQAFAKRGMSKLTAEAMFSAQPWPLSFQIWRHVWRWDFLQFCGIFFIQMFGDMWLKKDSKGSQFLLE